MAGIALDRNPRVSDSLRLILERGRDAMATKAELEKELQELRQAHQALKQQLAQDNAAKAQQDADHSSDVSGMLQDLLKEHGFDRSSLDATGEHLAEELKGLQQQYPLVMLLGAFVLGCALGRSIR